VLITAGVENLLKPILVGKRVNMHSLLVFFSIIGGLYMSGILGVIYGPLIMTFFLTLTDIYNSNYKMLVEPARETSFDDINLI
jgi:predicted PurR-regulated permease PerM